MATWHKSDCADFLPTIPDNSVQLIYVDPPFNSATRNWWDSKLNWKLLFQQIFRILTENGTLVIHCSQPFTYELIREAPYAPSFHYIWNKGRSTNPFLAKIQPLRCCEEILVWRKKKATYYPQRVGTEKRLQKSSGVGTYYGATSEQPLVEVIGRWQTHYLDYKPYHNKRDKFATRPRELVELMIQSFSKPGDTVLDFTCYTGISGKVSLELGRKWIGCDKYFYPLHLLQKKV